MANIFSKIGDAFKKVATKIGDGVKSVVNTVKEKFPTIVAAAANGAANGGIVGAIGGAIAGATGNYGAGDTYEDVSTTANQNNLGTFVSGALQGGAIALAGSGSAGSSPQVAVATSSTMAENYIKTTNFLLAGGLSSKRG